MTHVLLALCVMLACSCATQRMPLFPAPLAEKSTPSILDRSHEPPVSGNVESAVTLWYYPERMPAPEPLIRLYLPEDARGDPLPVPGGLIEGLRLGQTETSHYDANGRRVSLTVVSEHRPPLIDEYTYAYSDRGLPLRVEGRSTSANPAHVDLTSIREYLYGDDGSLLQQKNRVFLAGKPEPESVHDYFGYVFDAGGRMLQRLRRSNGELFSLQKFTYDLEGRLLRRIELDLTPSPPVYDGDPHEGLRQVAPAEHRRNDFDVDTLYAYGRSGRLAEVQVHYGYLSDAEADAVYFAEHGSLETALRHPSEKPGGENASLSTTVKRFAYDANGRKVREYSFSDRFRDRSPDSEIRWLYDERGNWIRRVYRYGRGAFRVEERRITYRTCP